MKKNKLLAVLLALAMTLSLLPTAALAEEEITINTSEELAAALKNEETANIVVNLAADITYDVTPWIHGSGTMGGENTESITINGNNHKITFNNTDSDWNGIYIKNENATLTINNATITNSGYNDGPWNRHNINFHCKVVLNNVISDKAIAVAKDSTLNGCTISDSRNSDDYLLWIQALGETVNVKNCEFQNTKTSGTTRGIAIKDQYVDSPASVTLNVSGTKFTTAKKAAVLVTSTAGANITWGDRNDINGVSADSTNAVWVDEGNPAAPVTITGGTGIVENAGETVASVRNVKYDTLTAAIDAAQSGDTVTLLTNLNGQVTIPEGKSFTLNMNGKEITNNGGFGIINRGELTITGDGTISAKYPLRNEADGSELTIENGTYHSVEGAITVRTSNSKVTVNGGTFTATDNAVIASNGTSGLSGNTITINGGTFTGGIITSGYVACGIYAPNDDTVTVAGGTFNITGGAGIVARAGNITVSGGTFNCTGNVTGKVGDSRVVVPCSAIVFDSSANYPGMTSDSKIVVSGGMFTSEDAVASTIDEAARISITGGTFSTDPTAYKAEGKIVRVDSSTYTVVADTNVGAGTYLTEPSSVASGYQKAQSGDHWVVSQIPSTPSDSGSSGGGSSNTSTTTEKNPDGSTTTTTTDKKTGTVTETTKTPEGATGTVVTDKNGDVTEITASVSSSAAKEASKTGEAVTLPVEVPAADSAADAPAVEITVPKSAGSVKVEIPVEDVTPGTVAVIVHADGSEKIVSTSVVTEGGVALTLDGSATVKIIDNSKDFVDVPETNVFYNEISSLSAREIMIGKTEDTFDLYNSVTLNQIANVAGRITGAVDVSDFSAGVAWGSENGLKTGNVAATRGDVLKALYIAAGSPAVEDTSILARFNDAASIPADMAAIAAWAARNGILKGTDAGAADLSANVTRGQACALAGRTMGVLA